MPHSCLFVFAAIIGLITSNSTAQYDGDDSEQQLRLQDLNIELNQKDNQRENLELVLRKNLRNKFDSSLQNVRPLQQKVADVGPLRLNTIQYVPGVAGNFNFGVRPLAYNGLHDEVVSYSRDNSPTSHNLRRPPLQLLSNGRAGYGLDSADVLLPPFHDGESTQKLYEQPSQAYVQPLEDSYSYNGPTSPYSLNEAINSPSLSISAASYLANREVSEANNNAIIEYANNYLPINRHSSQRPIVQYGSPHADYRRPTLYRSQSNQLAFAPIRSNNDALSQKERIPYPPSFISITTRRPLTDSHDNEGAPLAVRPLGRSLVYDKLFRPSAVDPVPDFWANRQPTSIIDSYIPSWVIARILDEQRINGNVESFQNDERIGTTQKQGDEKERKEQIADIKVVRKSLREQPNNYASEMSMMT